MFSHATKAALIASSALAGAFAATPARAEWETVHNAAIREGSSCSAAHTRDPAVARSEGRPLEVAAGYSGLLEIYGHGIDLSPDAEVTGMPSINVAIERRVSGATNAARGCGAIGSIVVGLRLPPNAPADTGVLRIGSERIPLRTLNATISTTEWSRETLQPDDQPITGGGGSGATRPITFVNDGNTGCSPTNCPQNNSSGSIPGGAISGGAPASGGRTDLRRYHGGGIGACIANAGGAIELEDRLLAITLPRQRSDAALRCLTEPAIFEVRGASPEGDIGPTFRAAAGFNDVPPFHSSLLPPGYTAATSGLTGPRVVDRERAEYQEVAMSRELASTLVGERRVALTSSTRGASALTLVLRSDPAQGIRAIEGLPAGSRASSTIEARFDFLAAHRGNENVAWRLGRADGGDAAPCFAATSGTLVATSAIGRLPLTATERPGCVGVSYALTIGPVDTGGRAVFDQPYGARATFTLPVLTAPSISPTLPRAPLPIRSN